MSSEEPHKDFLIPLPNGPLVMRPHSKAWLSRPKMAWMTFFTALMVTLFRWYPVMAPWAQVEVKSFSSTVKRHFDVCPAMNPEAASYTGHVELDGPGRRSFYWFFEAQTSPKNAPIILTFGGGPGITGMSYPLRGESHCRIEEPNITVVNEFAWTRRFNLLALDHPLGVGFSSGTVVGRSDKVAEDVYEFLQRFLAPEGPFNHLAGNQFIISSGSYGGIYVPHIAKLILSKNREIDQGHAPQSAIGINLESVMLNAPMFDGMTHYRWLLHPRCKNNRVYDQDTCAALSLNLPRCLDVLQRSLDRDSPELRRKASSTCYGGLDAFTEKCLEKITHNGEVCYFEGKWISEFMNSTATKLKLGVPDSQHFHYTSSPVYEAFLGQGDDIQNTQELYEGLLHDGIRILAYVGDLDYNCHWRGVVSFLKLLRSSYQEDFIRAQFKQWPAYPGTVVRAVGPGAGKIAFIGVGGAGHLSVTDKPHIIQDIVEHWIDNTPYWHTERPKSEPGLYSEETGEAYSDDSI